MQCACTLGSPHAHMFILLPVSTQTLMYVLQREQKELSASKAVVKDQSKESNEGKKPVVKKQEGGTIYIGFEKE